MESLHNIDKRALLRSLIARIQADLISIEDSQRATIEGATHEESRAENDKDTRALESTYLARGLAQRVQELQNSISQLQSWNLSGAQPRERLALGSIAVVEDEDSGESRLLWIAPTGGGLALDAQNMTLLVVTPQSPLGSGLIGRQRGDVVEAKLPQGVRSYEIVDIR